MFPHPREQLSEDSGPMVSGLRRGELFALRCRTSTTARVLTVREAMYDAPARIDGSSLRGDLRPGIVDLDVLGTNHERLRLGVDAGPGPGAVSQL